MVYRPAQLILRNFEGNIRLGLYVSVWMGRKNSEIFYDNIFIFDSTGFDPKFVAFVATR